MKLTKYILTLLIIPFFCLSSYAHKEKWDENKSDWSDLMLSIYKGKNEKVKKLIDKGVAINYMSTSRFKLNAIEVAIRKENEYAFQLLVATDSISDLKDYIRLASAQKSALIVEEIIKNGGNVNDTLENGHSVLMYSASFGSYDVFETLLKKGANVHQTRRVDGWNALLLASFNGELDKVKLLLKYGANKKHKDKNGRTAYDLIESLYDRYNVSLKDKEEFKKILK